MGQVARDHLIWINGRRILARVNEIIQDEAFFYTLEAAALLDPRGLRDMVEVGTESGSIYRIDNPKDHDAVFPLVKGYLSRKNADKRESLVMGVVPTLFRAVCYGRNVGKLIVGMSPIYKHLTDLPNLREIRCDPTEDDIQLARAWTQDDADIGKLIRHGADDITMELNTTGAYLAACNMAAIILMHTELQAQEQL
jgi:hypothetical protein